MLGTLTQKKFAETLQKEKLKQSKQKKNIMAPPQDLPISAEMISLIEANINQLDEEGYLSEGVGSILTQPLNSMSVYCPAAAVLDSKFTATKTLSLTNRSKSGTGFGFGNTTGTGFGTATGLGSGFGTGMVGSTNVDFSRSLTQELMKTSTTTRKPIDEAKSRLEVFWLQRKAQLAREEGRLMEAKAILDEAIKEHLGTSNYEEARLAEPVLTADPKDAFEMVNNDFAIYDTVAHGNAGKLQRFWLRIYRAKWKSATDIARAYRGFHVRKIIRRIHHLRLQCAKLIQRRFRMHLVRMHRLATMVKVWYKLRKDVKAFQRKLFRFQMARKIQCLFRGNKGRAIAYERKVLISSVHRVQRNSRGYTQRRDRAAALRWYHKIFYTAARRIQCLVRRVQAVHRAQMKLLIVLSNENIRYRKERLVVEETLRMKRLHNTFYADTHPGKLHLRDIRRQVRLKQMKRKSRSAALSEEEQATDFVISIAEQYDEEGTGYFSSIWLKKVLARLNIYVDKHQLSYLIGILDHEDKGMINISEFIDWYNSEDADYFVEPEDFVSLAAKRYLQARNTAKNVLQLVDPSVRLRRELNRISSTSTINDTVSTFRMRHPPKYQCCQCLSPFALFTDYFLHFSKKGICPTTGLKGLYFRKYWIQQDWTKQRALEAETIRANVEFSLVNEAAKRKCYGELVENKDKMLKKILKKEYQLAYGIIQDKIGLTRTMDEVNVGIQTVLLEALSINTSSKLHTLLMDIIAEEYQLPLRIDLTIEEDPLTIEEGRLWIKKYFPVNKLKAKAVDFTITDDFNTRDTSAANTKSQEKISDKNLHRNYIDLCNNVVERNTIWKTVKKKLLILSKVYVEILRLLQIEAQASLYALIEFRSKRPRKLEIDNIELEKLGMHSLTTYNYNKTFVSLQKKIMEINAIFASIYSRSLPKYCTLNTRPSSAAVIPAETIKEEKSKTNKSNNAKLIMESKNVNNTSIQANNSSAKKESVKGSVKFSNEPPEVLQDSKKSQSETIGKISQKNSDKLSSSKGQESNGMVSSSKTLSNKADEDDDEEDEEDIDEDSEEESSGSDEDGSDTSGDESYESSEKENIRVENLKTDVKVSSEVNLLKFKTHESLVRSKIQLNHKLNNSVGRFQFVRLAQELCIAYKTEVGSDRIISNLLSETSRSKLEYELIWIFMKLSSLVPNENIDLWDLDMLLSKLNLKVPHFYEKIVRDQLDPEGKGGVTYNYLLHWLTVGNYLKYKKRWNFNWNEMFSSIESIDAYEIYLVRQRIMNRLLMVLFENMSKLPADTFDQTMHEEDRAVIKFSYLEYFHQLCAELKLEAENLFVDVERATSPVADMDPIEDQVNENMNNASAEKMPVPEDQLISTDKNFDKTDNSLLTDSRSVSEIANSELKSSIASTGIEGGKQLRISDTLKYAAMDSVDKEHFLHSWRKMSYLRSFEAILDTREVYKVIENKYESKFWRNRYKRVNRHCEHSEFLFLEASALMTKSLSTFCPIVESEATQNRRGIGVPEVVVDEEDSILQNSAALYANPELCYQERPSHELTFLMALDVYMHSFDTDCSGTFDENELKTLLKSLKLPADDRTILQTFPTFAYVTDDFDGCVHISINQLQSFLLDVFAQNPQQSYFKALNLSQYTKQWLAPRLTAVLRRQVARRQIQQTIRLSKEGQVVFGENYQREVGGYSLLLRSQMIAMRQVFLFRESVFCQLKIFTMAITLKNVWRTCANGIKGDKDTAERLHIIREQMLRYAYYIHCERGGLLITEMLHLVHFLVERMKFPQTQSLSSVTALLCNVKNGKELYWLSFDDAMAILGPYLDGCGYGMILTHPVDDLKDNVPVPFQFNFLNDADCRMLSIARQQALLISMNFQDIIVPETNYRCSVLGLMAVLQRSKGVVHWPVIRRLNAAFKSKGLDPGILPKEVVPVMMLSYGYSFADIIHPGLMEFVSLNHPDGKLASDLVRVIEVKARIASEITRVSTFGTRFQLKCRYPVSSLKYTVLYRKIAKAIQLKSDQINVYGGEYLKEIITGISQHPRWLN